MMLNTIKEVPREVANCLTETETFVDQDGKIRTATKYQPVLKRYDVLLQYGYSHRIDRGFRHWQRLKKAKELRDYYTHLDVSESHALSAGQVLDFMESVLIGIIWPSSEIKRTQLLGVYRLYWIWDSLRKRTDDYKEQPLFMNWRFESKLGFYCPFPNADSARFPNSQEENAREVERNKRRS